MNVVYNVQGKKKRWQYRYSPVCAKDRSGNTFVRAPRGEKIEADSLTLRSRDAPKIAVGKDGMIFEVGKSLIDFQTRFRLKRNKCP